jgi:hypothetical protein
MNEHDALDNNPYEEALKSSSSPAGDEDNPDEPPAQGG